jgi:pyruvate formate lyase activating enzyme
MYREKSKASPVPEANYPGIMIRCRQTAWAIGFVPLVQIAGIRPTRTQKVRNMGIRTLPSSPMPAHSIAYTAKTGIFEIAHLVRYEPVDNLVQAVNATTSCVCYFGGDPSPQLPYLLKASQMMRDNNRGRILRICWETNGAMSKAMLRDLADMALVSGGCIKFDLKAWDEILHIALTGVTNKQTIDNFRWLSDLIPSRPDPPFLIAGTTLVPGYIDAQEVGQIARFIASLDPNIPYSLLAFHPEYKMNDLPCTSRKQAQKCLQAAKDAGLKRVHIGNRHLLW